MTAEIGESGWTEELEELGWTLAVAEQSAAEMTVELRKIHNEFIRNRAAEHSYRLMAFLAVKAIECCRQLEGSDGRSDTRDHGADRAAGSAGDGGPASAQADRGAPEPPGNSLS